MGFLFSEVFWGILLIILGVSVVIKVVFNVNLPIFRILFSFFLIYIGIRILMGGFGVNPPKNMVLFNDSEIKGPTADNNYNVIFGKGVIDLTDPALVKTTTKVEVNTIFGGGFIKLNPKMPLIIVVNSAFAGAKLPDGNIATFGKYTYKSPNFIEGQNHLEIDANVVFGGLEIINAEVGAESSASVK
jgi:hypothetical protein